MVNPVVVKNILSISSLTEAKIMTFYAVLPEKENVLDAYRIGVGNTQRTIYRLFFKIKLAIVAINVKKLTLNILFCKIGIINYFFLATLI